MRTQTRTIVWLLALLGGAIALPPAPVTPRAAAQSGPARGNAPLTDEQVRALVELVLANQKRDDHALQEYDRTEHLFVRGNGKNTPDRDTFSRIVPIGNGEAHVELERNGKPADPAEIAKQWDNIERALVTLNAPPTSRSKEDDNKAAKRKQEQDDVIASIGDAFNFHFVGRTVVGGHSIVELSFEPNTSYRSSWRFAIVFAHTRGRVWVDESAAQLVRLVAELSDDITFAAGLIARVHRGGRFTFSQEEVDPGIWLPTHSTSDFDGSKFVFGNLSLHERTDASGYRRMGPPEQALALVRREHPSAAISDP